MFCNQAEGGHAQKVLLISLHALNFPVVRILWFLMGALWLGTVGCRSDPPPAPAPHHPYEGPGFFICNEGNFRWGNASLSFFSEDSMTIFNGIFKQANRRPLGDVAQSMAIMGGKGYVVVNNSGRIEVIDPLTARSEGTIGGLTSPRYLTAAGDGRAYVSDLYAQAVSVVSLDSNRVIDTIGYPDWTEEWVPTAAGIVGCGVKSGTVFLLDPATDRIVQWRRLRKEVAGMVLDRDDFLWVLCNGGFEEVLPALYRVELPTLTPVDSFVFPDRKSRPGHLAITPGADTLFFTYQGDLYRMPVAAASLPSTPYFSGGGRIIYHVVCHPRRPWLLLTDAIDYVQPGKLLILTRSPSHPAIIDSFTTGIIPGHITFVP